MHPSRVAAAAIEKLHRLHVDVRVLTGDNQDVAVSICRRLGIDTMHTLTGAELELLTDNEIPVKLEHTTVFSELSPKQKVQVVRTLRANGHTVGFLGDGMNDLPAIVESDVGISVDTAAETVKGSGRCCPSEKGPECAGRGNKGGAQSLCQCFKIHPDYGLFQLRQTSFPL